MHFINIFHAGTKRKHIHVKAISHRYSILTSTIYKYRLKFLQSHRRFKSISHESQFLLNWKFPSNWNKTNVESISCCFALKLQFAVVMFDLFHIHLKKLILMNIRIWIPLKNDHRCCFDKSKICSKARHFGNSNLKAIEKFVIQYSSNIQNKEFNLMRFP